MRKNTIIWRRMLFCVALCLFAAGTVCSCALYSYFSDLEHEQIECILPAWPETLPELDLWQVQIYCARSDSCVQFNVDAGQKSFTHKICKNKPLSICVLPVTKTGSEFHCAGAVYPACFTESKPHLCTAELSWVNGYAAYLMQSVIKASVHNSEQEINEYLGRFNWKKLVQTLNDRQSEESEVFYNPWLLDIQQVLEGIAYKNFTATRLRLTGVISVCFDFPLYSPYVPENQVCMTAADQNRVVLRKNKQTLFELPGTAAFRYSVLICAASEKNISLEFISMPI